MIMKRHEYLGVVPARSDAAEAAGGISEIIYRNLDQGDVVIMPSIREIEQVWTPAQTFFQDLAKDAFRTTDKKYTSLDLIKEGLESVDQQIYDAIHTLAGSKRE